MKKVEESKGKTCHLAGIMFKLLIKGKYSMYINHILGRHSRYCGFHAVNTLRLYNKIYSDEHPINSDILNETYI